MLLRAKIKNKDQIAQLYLDLKKNVTHPTKKQRRSITLKQFSCALCLRFLNDPVSHKDCPFSFCRECLVSWTLHFPFCNRCKADLPFEEARTLETDQPLLKVIREIRIDCSLGKCLAAFKPTRRYNSESNLAMIEERTVEHDSVEIQKPKKLGFFRSFFALESDRMISSSRNTSMNVSISRSLNHSQNSVLDSSFNRVSSSSQNLPVYDSRRYYTTQDYAFHLMRQHFWPKMEVRRWVLEGDKRHDYVSSLNKNQSAFNDSYFYDSANSHKDADETITAVAFAGYKQNQKLGPGVVYYVRGGRKIDTHLGAFVNDVLDSEATIFRNGKLVYDGGISKGIREGLATQRYYFEIEGDTDTHTDTDKDRVCYVEYKGTFVNDKRNGHGEVHFYGNLQVFTDYFSRLKEYKAQENANAGIEDSYVSEAQFGNPVITNHVDSKFNIERIFRNVPVVFVESEEDFKGDGKDRDMSVFTDQESNIETSGGCILLLLKAKLKLFRYQKRPP